MGNYTVRKYLPTDFADWNEFVRKAKNATFLFDRDYMDYHADRFEDYSMLIYRNEKLVAVVPANIVGAKIYSHQGLTYGGIAYSDIDASDAGSVFESVLRFLKGQGITEFIIKPIPMFLHKFPANELDYFLFSHKAVLVKREMNLAIDFSKKLEISKSKLKHFRRVSQLGMTIRKERRFDGFWNEVLIPRLREKHNVAPVHTLSEIELLGSKFPDNICQYNVYFDEKIIAGLTIYDLGHAVKSQYGATTEIGEKMRALDFLFLTLINEFSKTHDFFDMGTVTENNESGYNPGLLKQKQELGCAVYNQDQYSISI